MPHPRLSIGGLLRWAVIYLPGRHVWLVGTSVVVDELVGNNEEKKKRRKRGGQRRERRETDGRKKGNWARPSTENFLKKKNWATTLSRIEKENMRTCIWRKMVNWIVV